MESVKTIFKSVTWKKLAIAVAAAFVLHFLVVGLLIKTNKKHDVTHFQEVRGGQYGPDGRAAVGSPEVFRIDISPAVCWEQSKAGTGFWRSMGFVFLVVTALYVILAMAGVFDKLFGSTKRPYGQIGWVLLIISIGCLVAAYSSAFANNYVEIGRAEFDAMGGTLVNGKYSIPYDQAVTLFENRPLIK